MNKKIGVVGIPGKWSSETLADAVENKTGFRLLISMEEVTVDLDDGRVWFREHDLTTFDAILIKKLAPSYDPQMMNRLEILRFLEANGVAVFSKPQRIAALLNRLNCTTTLRLGRIPIPPTVITEDVTEATRIIRRFGSAVLKPLFTSKARGMIKVEATDADCEQKVRRFQAEGNQTLYIQQFATLPDRDLGLVFVGGQYLATYARVRQNGSWNTTTVSGGRYEPVEPADDLIELAYRAQSLFGLDFTCVDLAEANEGPIVFEVSAFGGFHGLQVAHHLNAADRWVDYVLTQLEEDNE